MDWKEKIIEVMKLIKEGCTERKNCIECPLFGKFCCYDASIKAPHYWIMKEEDKND